MTGDLLGRVVVVAGEEPALEAVARAAAAAGALVAVTSQHLPDLVEVTVRFRADAGRREVWDRVAMHVEQHLGPVDGVATDAGSAAVVSEVFAHDLARRGHGEVVVVAAGDEPEALVSRLCTRRATPPRSDGDGPGR